MLDAIEMRLPRVSNLRPYMGVLWNPHECAWEAHIWTTCGPARLLLASSPKPH